MASSRHPHKTYLQKIHIIGANAWKENTTSKNQSEIVKSISRLIARQREKKLYRI